MIPSIIFLSNQAESSANGITVLAIIPSYKSSKYNSQSTGGGKSNLFSLPALPSLQPYKINS